MAAFRQPSKRENGKQDLFCICPCITAPLATIICYNILDATSDAIPWLNKLLQMLLKKYIPKITLDAVLNSTSNSALDATLNNITLMLFWLIL